MATIDSETLFRSSKTTSETLSKQWTGPTIDHPLKEINDLEEIAKYALMPKGVALAAFAHSNSSSVQIQSDNYAESEGLDSRKREDSALSLESLDLDLPPLESYKVETVPFPKSPQELRQKLEASGVPLPLEDHSPVSETDASLYLEEGEEGQEDEDRSMYQAYLSPDCNNVKLKKDPLYLGPGSSGSAGFHRRRRIRVSPEILSSVATDTDTATDTTLTEQMYTARGSSGSAGGSDTELDDTFMPDLDSPDELEDSILERLGNAETEGIPELTALEERNESRHWRTVTVAGEERCIDMKVIEPYKRVLSHGGYLSAGSHNAIIVFSACFLPDRSRVDYDYVMDNLFLYVLTTLDQLITEDYVLIFLHGATRRSVIPTFPWIKRCYQMIDRRLRKTLQGLYIVHPTFWLKTLVVMTKPFISAKFSRKLRFVNSLDELYNLLPLEVASIPDKVKKYDEIKQCIVRGSNYAKQQRV